MSASATSWAAELQTTAPAATDAPEAATTRFGQLRQFCAACDFSLLCHEPAFAERVYRTEMCTLPTPCPKGASCRYAHSKEELRDKPLNYTYNYELLLKRPGMETILLQHSQGYCSLPSAKEELASRCIDMLGDAFSVVPIMEPPVQGESIGMAIDSVLIEAGAPILASRLAELLYLRADGPAFRAQVKAEGGLSMLLSGMAGVRLLYDDPPGFTPPVSSVARIIQGPDQRDEHLTYLTNNSKGESWSVAGKAPIWTAAGAPLAEVTQSIPSSAKGIDISKLRALLQEVLHSERTVKSARLVAYLQGYPDRFTFRASPDGVVYNVVHTKHAPPSVPKKQHLVHIIRGLIAQEPNTSTHEQLVSSLGGKFGNLYPELNVHVRSQYGGFNAFVSMNAKALLPDQAVKDSHHTPWNDDPMVQQALEVLRSLVASSSSRHMTDWSGSLGGSFGNTHPQLNAHLKSRFGSFGAFLSQYAVQILPAATSSGLAQSISTADDGFIEFLEAGCTNVLDHVDFLTSNRISSAEQPPYWQEPLPQIVEVIRSYGSEGADVGLDLKLRLGKVLKCERTIKLPRLLSYLKDFQRTGHFYVEDVHERVITHGCDHTIHGHVYSAHHSPQVTAPAEVSQVSRLTSATSESVLGKDKAWAQLNEDETAAACVLGYRSESWDDGLVPSACTFPWNQLSSLEQGAAQVSAALSRARTILASRHNGVCPSCIRHSDIQVIRGTLN